MATKKLSKAQLLALSNNQDFHRLTNINSLNSLSKDLQDEIKQLVSSTDAAHRYAAVFMLAVLSNNKPVIVIGRDDLPKLVGKANTQFKTNFPELNQKRGPKGQEKTIYSQLMGFLINADIIKVLKPSQGNRPQVWEIVRQDFLDVIGSAANDDYRLMVINSTCKVKYTSYDAYKADNANNTNETNDTNKTYNTNKGKQAVKQAYNEPIDEPQIEQDFQDNVTDINELALAAQLNAKLQDMTNPDDILNVLNNEFRAVKVETVNQALQDKQLAVTQGWGKRFKYLSNSTATAKAGY